MRSSFVLFTLGFVGFVTSFGAHVVAVNLPIYAQQFGVGLRTIGALIAVYDLAEVFAKPVFGLIADRKGLKNTMLVGIGFFSLASLAYLFVSPRLLIFIRFLQGAGAAALSISSAALVAQYFPTNRGRAFGVYNALKGTGYVLSPIIGAAIVWKTNFAMIFLASFAAGILSLVLSLLLPKVAVQGGFDEDDDLSLKQLLMALQDRKLLPWFFIIIINMFLIGDLFGFLPVYVHALGYSQLTNGLVIGAAAIAYLLIQPLAGRLADHFNLAYIVAAGLALSSLGVLLIPFTTGATLVAAAIVAAIGAGTVGTNTDAVVSNLADRGRLGATLGAAGSFKELGDMLGPLVMGVVSQGFGLKLGFMTGGLLGLFAMIISHRVFLPRAQVL